MVKGYGRDCAAQLGLTGGSVDTGHAGPDLLDLLADGADRPGDPDDCCDGWDHPAGRP